VTAMKNTQELPGLTWVRLVAWLALWCGVALQAAWAAEPIKLGVTASLSGVYAGPGQEQLEGIKMWVHDINARGALLGRKVELVDYDDQSDPAVTRRLYEKLITDDKVDLLIGPYSSDLTLVASEVAERHDFPMVAAGAASSRIWSRGYRNIVQVDAPAREYMNLLLKSASENAGLTRIALIYPAAEFSREVAAGVRDKAPGLGMTIVFEEEYPLEMTDFTELVRRMRVTAPELVIGATYLDDSIALVREAKRQQFSPKALAFTVGPALPEFGNALGADADGIIGVVPWMRSGNVPMAYDFSFRFKEQFGRNAGVHAAQGYGAGQVLEAGVRLAGSLDKAAIREQLHQMVFRSLLGNYRVDETGRQLDKTAYLMQWQDGYRLLVAPKELRDAPIIYPFKPWSER
jgi:branched-chain amino acid transport system substrate-binding protein